MEGVDGKCFTVAKKLLRSYDKDSAETKTEDYFACWF